MFSVTLQVPAAALEGRYLNTTSDVTARANSMPITGDPATDSLLVCSIAIAPGGDDCARNSAPTDVALSRQAVDENILGAVVGNLSVVDPDTGDTHSFDVSDDRFEVLAGQLKLKADVHLLRSVAATVEVMVSATDNGTPPMALSETFTIQVVMNEFPWQNRDDKFDVDADAERLDVFKLIALIRQLGNGTELAVPRPAAMTDPEFPDVEPDNLLTRIDVFTLIARVRNPPPSGEGEAAAPDAMSGGSAAALPTVDSDSGVSPEFKAVPHSAARFRSLVADPAVIAPVQDRVTQRLTPISRGKERLGDVPSTLLAPHLEALLSDLAPDIGYVWNTAGAH